MRTFNSFDQKTFEQLAKLTQLQLKKVVSTYLKKHYKAVVETDDYVYAIGDIPIALCAHMDTVFIKPPEEIYFDRQKNVMWSPQGLGADDRAGVFAILTILRSGLRPHVIFTTDEESGAIGASALAKLDCPFNDLRYIVQLDRRGSNDCVFYDCDNEQFNSYIETFGFNTAFGTFSDISVLCPAWSIAGANLSVGYREEHSTSEVLFVGQLMSTIEKVKNMLQVEQLPTMFEYIPSKYVYHFYDYGFGHSLVRCGKCGKHFMEEETFPAIMLDKSTKHLCVDCITDYVAWCEYCGSAFEKADIHDPQTGLCPLCKDLKENKHGRRTFKNTKAI